MRAMKCLAVVTLLGLASVAQAVVIQIDDRSVYAGNGESTNLSGQPHFAVSRSWSDPFGSASASQDSITSLDPFYGLGTWSGTGSFVRDTGAALQTGAGSLFDVTFRVFQPTPFTLTGSIVSDDSFDGQFGTNFAPTSLSGNFALSGVLTPVQDYRLRLYVASGSGSTCYDCSGSWQFTLIIPEPSLAFLLLALTPLLALRAAPRASR